MRNRTRFGLTRILKAIALVAAVNVVTSIGSAQPGSASATTLCTGYASCAHAGYSTHGYENHPTTSYWGQFSGHNCTNYAAYVMKSVYGVADHNGLGNAGDWATNAQKQGVLVDHVPTLGSVAQWPANTGGAGKDGHVAVVEVVAKGYIEVSEDNFGGDFHWIKFVPGGYYPVNFIHFAAPNFEPTVGDLNGDQKSDIGLRKIVSGVWYFKHGPNFGDQTTYNWGPGAGSDFEPIVGDFNGDGKWDIGLRRISTGVWYFKHGPNFGDQTTYNWSSGAGVNLEPITGDFNGDGKGDIALRRISTGVWYFKHGPNFTDQTTYNWSPGAG